MYVRSLPRTANSKSCGGLNLVGITPILYFLLYSKMAFPYPISNKIIFPIAVYLHSQISLSIIPDIIARLLFYSDMDTVLHFE